jgi:hypothetical protein
MNSLNSLVFTGFVSFESHHKFVESSARRCQEARVSWEFSSRELQRWNEQLDTNNGGKRWGTWKKETTSDYVQSNHAQREPSSKSTWKLTHGKKLSLSYFVNFRGGCTERKKKVPFCETAALSLVGPSHPKLFFARLAAISVQELRNGGRE